MDKIFKKTIFFDRLLLILAAVLVVAIPLYPKFPALDVPGTYVHVRVEDFLVAVAILVTGLRWLLAKGTIPANKVASFIILYWGAGLLSLFSAVFVNHLVIPHLALLHYLRRIEYMALFFLGFWAVKKWSQLKDIFAFLFGGAFLVFIYGLGQKFFGFPVVSTMDKEFAKGILLRLNIWTRISATFGGHYDLAAYLSLILPLLLVIIFSLKDKRKIALLSLIYLFSYYLLILTASRTSFLAYLLVIFFLMFFLRPKVWIILILALSILGSFFSQDINQRFAATIKTSLPKLATVVEGVKKFWLSSSPPSSPPSFSLSLTDRKITPVPSLSTSPSLPSSSSPNTEVSPLPSPTRQPKQATPSSKLPVSKEEAVEMGVERSGNIRFQVEWPRAIRHFYINPLLGTGYSSITLATDNDYLRSLGETGLLGFLSFFLIPAEAFLFFLQNFKGKRGIKKKMAVAGMAWVLAMLLNAFFIDVFEASKVAYIFWLIMGSLIGFLSPA